MQNTSIFLLQGIFTLIDSEGEGDIYEKDVIDYIKKQNKGKMDIKVWFRISFYISGLLCIIRSFNSVQTNTASRGLGELGDSEFEYSGDTCVWHPSILPLSRDEKDWQYTSLSLLGVFSPDRKGNCLRIPQYFQTHPNICIYSLYTLHIDIYMSICH